MDIHNIVGTSVTIEYLAKKNDGKRPGFGHTLIAISYYGRCFVVVKDGVKYKSKTLKELRKYFSGYYVESITECKVRKSIQKVRQ